MSVKPIGVDALDAFPHGFLGREGGVSQEPNKLD